MEHFKRKLNNEAICGIYEIINLINNKVYIGKSIDIERRWNQHKYGKTKLVISNSINKYGLDNFNFNILEEINLNNLDKLTLEKKLVDLEQKWMDIKKSYLKEYGYNINKTSKPNTTPKRNDDFSKKISKIKIDMNHGGQMVIQYDMNGNKIKEWKSAAEIERKLNILSENISGVCLKKQKSAGGFIWRKQNDILTKDEIKDINTLERNRKKIIKQSLNGEEVEIFNSLIDAAKSVNSKYSSAIVHVCKGRHKSYRGYKWMYVNE